jgi:winged helix DNA-binding protein
MMPCRFISCSVTWIVTQLLDDYVLAASAAIITATVVILTVLLWRYRQLVKEADTSSRLAKDVWDSVASRFSVVDTRIIDLMAKTEVLSSRSAHSHVTSQQRTSSATGWVDGVVGPTKAHESVKVVVSPVVLEGTDTEAKVLRLLAKGPRTSAQIKDEVSRSREHTARLMKGLFERGLVVRNDRNKPYVYEITESGKTYVTS